MLFGKPRPLTHLQGRCLSPEFSPDGKWITFSGGVNDRWNIYVVRRDGSNLVRLTNATAGRNTMVSGLSGAAYYAPRFSPNSKQIVYTHVFGQDEEYTDICVLDLDTGSERILTNTHEDSNPRFSPDGEYILFRSSRDTANQRSKISEIYRMRIDGSEQTQLTHTHFDQAGEVVIAPTNSDPCYSPDGQFIAFGSTVHCERGKNQFEIYRMNPDGSQITRLTHSDGSSSSFLWHPNSMSLAYTCWPHHRNAKRIAEIFVVNADGSGQRRLEESNAVNWLGSFSPDGRYLAFDSIRDGKSDYVPDNWDIYLRHMDTGEIQRLTDNAALDKHPRFSPDGTSLIFISRLNGVDELHVIDILT